MEGCDDVTHKWAQYFPITNQIKGNHQSENITTLKTEKVLNKTWANTKYLL